MNGGLSAIFHPESPQAAAISHLFLVVLITCGVILAIVIGMVGIALWRYRQRPGTGEPEPFFGNRKLEIFWAAVPTMIVIWLFILTARGMQQSDPTPKKNPDLIIVAHQWWWEARYPKTPAVTANEIHIPTGRKWLVDLKSADVIHDFWVPALARKMDVVPGVTNQIWLEADAPGKYPGTCAEYCGAEHAWMRFTVVAQSPEAYHAWLQQQEQTADAPTTAEGKKGLHIFRSKTCVNCHSIRGVSAVANAAPDLTHVGGRAAIGAGILNNTKTNLFRWLKNPQAIKPGCFMPNLKLSNQQAHALASYLEQLK